MLEPIPYEKTNFFLELGIYVAFTFIISYLLTRIYVRLAYKYKLGKNIQASKEVMEQYDFYKFHTKKHGTPTMAGVIFWISIAFTVGFSRFLSFYGVIEKSLLNRGEVYLPLFTLITCGLLGAVDDYINVRDLGKKRGMSAIVKFGWLTLFAILGAYWFYFKLGFAGFTVPAFGYIELGWPYMLVFIFMFLASTNAVNITDGLDGLAGGLSMIVFTLLAALTYLEGHFILSLFCVVITASLLVFLWFNIAPARFYMGDTGAIALGGMMAVIFMMTDNLIVLPIAMGVFAFETLTSGLQMIWRRIFDKKLFRIAPYHHHLEAIGWTENQIVIRFWIIGAALALLSFIIVFYFL